MATEIIWLPLNLGKSFLVGDEIHPFVANQKQPKGDQTVTKVIETILGCTSMYFEMNGLTTHIFSIINPHVKTIYFEQTMPYMWKKMGPLWRTLKTCENNCVLDFIVEPLKRPQLPITLFFTPITLNGPRISHLHYI
jgi:hypothetical protein